MNTRLQFKYWLEEQELEESWWKKALLYGALPLAAGTAATPFTTKLFPQQPPAKVVQQDAKSQFIERIKSVYKVDVRPEQVEFVRPSDVIAPMYGGKWADVRAKAKAAQEAPQKVGDTDVEIPAMNTAAVSRVSHLDNPIPVIYADPTLFGQGPEVNGFCNHAIQGKFCVVKDRSLLHTLRHELTHSTQDTTVRGSLAPGRTDMFGKYFMDEEEIGVRLGEMKRNYYQATGQIATSEKESFMGMIKHLYANPDKYSPDVRQLLPTIDKATREDKKAKEEGRESNLFPKLINYLRDNLDKMVRADQPGMHRAPMA